MDEVHPLAQTLPFSLSSTCDEILLGFNNLVLVAHYIAVYISVEQYQLE